MVRPPPDGGSKAEGERKLDGKKSRADESPPIPKILSLAANSLFCLPFDLPFRPDETRILILNPIFKPADEIPSPL